MTDTKPPSDPGPGSGPDSGPGSAAPRRTRADVRPPDTDAGERDTLLTFLDYLRESVVRKAEGVPDEAARTPGVPSGTSLHWLLAHLTAVELNWFEWAYAGQDGPLWDGEAIAREAATGEDLAAGYRDAVRRANAVVAACEDLDRPGARSLRPDAPAPTMRWLLVHMVEETGRHAGHADILRELYDGSAGR